LKEVENYGHKNKKSIISKIQPGNVSSP